MDYEQLLHQAQDNIDQADFMALREASTQLATYDPYGRRFSQKEFNEAINAGNWQSALDLGSAALEQNFVNADIHFGMAYCYKQLGKTDHEHWHGRFGAGLLRSVMGSGDGKSPETAFKVLYFREVYHVLGAMGLKLQQQALMNHGGQSFDRMACVAQDGTPVTLFFNITAYFGFEFRNLRPDNDA